MLSERGHGWEINQFASGTYKLKFIYLKVEIMLLKTIL